MCGSRGHYLGDWLPKSRYAACQLLPGEAGVCFAMSVSFGEQMEGILEWWMKQAWPLRAFNCGNSAPHPQQNPLSLLMSVAHGSSLLLVLQVLWAAAFSPSAVPSSVCSIATWICGYYLSLRRTSKSVMLSCHCRKGTVLDSIKKNPHPCSITRCWWDQLQLYPPWRSLTNVCHGAEHSSPAFSKTIHFVLRLRPAVSQLLSGGNSLVSSWCQHTKLSSLCQH